MTNDMDTVQEFQRRRRETWKAVKPFIALMGGGIAGFILMIVANDFHLPPDKKFLVLLFLFALIGISFLFIVLIIRAKYVCPRCNKIPVYEYSGQGGVDLNPDVCPYCGTRLK